MADGGVLAWLLGAASRRFLTREFGRRWLHTRQPAFRALLRVEDCLELLTELPAAEPRDLRARQRERYAAHQGLFAEGRLEPLSTSGDAQTLVYVQPVWSGAPANFWSASMCRTRLDGTHDKLSSDADVLRLLQSGAQDFLLDRDRQWTVIVNQIHGASEEMRAAHQALWATFGLSGGFNAYLTAPNSQGKEEHVDPHDVFVAQQSGRKRWLLRDTGPHGPLREVTLAPGDVLYLPQGIPHSASSVGEEPSLHLAMSVYRGGFAVEAVLGAWLALEGPTPQSEPLGLAQARLMDRWASILRPHVGSGAARGGTGFAQGCVDTQLLSALHPDELPSAMVRGLADVLAGAALTAEASLRVHGGAEGLRAAERLRTLADSPPAAQSRTLLRAALAAREHRWVKHYRVHGPRARRSAAAVAGLHIGDAATFRRSRDASAILTDEGALLLNGFRVERLPEACMPQLRYCLGLHAGAGGRSFAVRDIPGPRRLAVALVRLLWSFRGLESV